MKENRDFGSAIGDRRLIFNRKSQVADCNPMVIDCHVHISALMPGHGSMSRKLLDSFAFRFMRWRLGVKGEDERTERQLESVLVRTIDETPKLDAAVVLAFDAVYRPDGTRDDANTHLFVTNDYVMELARRHRKVLFGASVHPYRRDALDELERCVAGGAVLAKWLPNTQGMNPADGRCLAFYDALAQHRLPLLCHTGGEKSLPQVDPLLGEPRLLEPALQRGVTVILAHCGTRSFPGEPDWLDQFTQIVRKYPNAYGDTSALNLPMRSHAYGPALRDPQVRSKLVHGSDWPIIAIPPLSRLGTATALDLMADGNWMRRDVRIKQALGFDEGYWQRAGSILRLRRST